MMRIFIYEFTCAASAASLHAPEVRSLSPEGAAMLAAVTEDFAGISGCEVITLPPGEAEEIAFRRAAQLADATLVIAPEFDHLLAQRCQWVRDEGGFCLNPSAEGIALGSDKWRLAEHWRNMGVPTPETLLADESPPPWSSWVLKPRFGAGSLDTQVNGPPRPRGELGPMIVQPWLHGVAASVAFLCGPGQIVAMPPAAQQLSRDGTLKYLGGKVPLPEPWSSRALKIATKAARAIPGLCGYVGIDVLLGEDGNDWAIEMNPRLTTSYLGLRKKARFNLAAAIWCIARGEPPPEMRWSADEVEFAADGTVVVTSSVSSRIH
ncbi:MAG: ATP-grasp domain-containing protein [Gemmataceae bacterium]|nr:ATP-grasp domain-containing protein [Gemmataceae bacterium]